MNDPATVLISCHIPKTGGTSFRRMLKACHGERLVFLTRMPQAQPVRCELFPLLRRTYWYARSIDSHDLRYVPPKKFWPGARFSIILRDPIERFLSFYFFRRHHWARALRLDDEAEINRRLAADFPPFEAVLEQFAEYQTRFVGWGSFFKPAQAPLLEDAVGALAKYDYIGFSECTAELPRLISSDFPEISGATMPQENVTPRDAGNGSWRERLDRGQLERTRVKHTLDMRLYEEAIKLNQRRGHPVP